MFPIKPRMFKDAKRKGQRQSAKAETLLPAQTKAQNTLRAKLALANKARRVLLKRATTATARADGANKARCAWKLEALQRRKAEKDCRGTKSRTWHPQKW